MAKRKKQPSILSGIFTDFKDAFQLSDIFIPLEIGNIRYVAFIGVLALIYIANTHYAERSMRAIGELQKDLKELRWEYMTSKSELMFKSKQTEVVDLVEQLGLEELTQPPKKINVK